MVTCGKRGDSIDWVSMKQVSVLLIICLDVGGIIQVFVFVIISLFIFHSLFCDNQDNSFRS